MAVDLITRAVAVKPDFPDAHSNLGNALKALDLQPVSFSKYTEALQAAQPGLGHLRVGG